MDIIIPQTVTEFIPAGARLQLRLMQQNSVWLLNQFIRHRSSPFGTFVEHIENEIEQFGIREKRCIQQSGSKNKIRDTENFERSLNSMRGDILKACENVESTLDDMFPYQTDRPSEYMATAIIPLTKDHSHGTRIKFTVGGTHAG